MSVSRRSLAWKLTTGCLAVLLAASGCTSTDTGSTGTAVPIQSLATVTATVTSAGSGTSPSSPGTGTTDSTGGTGTSTTTTGTPATTGPDGDNPALDACDQLGIMPCARQVGQIRLPIAGSSIGLTYSSDRAAGRDQDRAPSADPIGLGGWTLSVLDSFDPSSQTEITGNGTLRHVTGIPVDQQTAVAASDGSTVTMFDATGRATAVLDGTTGATKLSFTWGDDGLTSVSDRSGVALTVVRTADGTPVRLDVAQGASTLLGTVSGRLAAVQYPDGSRARIAVDGSGLVTGWADPAGGFTGFAYDRHGRVSARTDSDKATTTYSRDLTAEKLTVTTTSPTGGRVVDAVTGGSTTTWTHTDAAGVTSSLQANGDQRILTGADGTTSTLALVPDPRWGTDAPLIGQLTSGQLSIQTNTSTDGTAAKPGALTQTFSVGGSTWKLGYDPATQTSTRTDPSGVTSSTSFDNTGRVLRSTRTGNIPVGYTYDGQGRLATVSLGSGSDARTWSYSYSGHTVTVRDPVGGVQERTLGAGGAVTKVAGPGEAGLTLNRDAAGRITGFAAPAGGEYRLTWGGNGRVAAISTPAGQGGVQFTGYNYDTGGNLIKRFTADTALTITRDAGGRIQTYDAGSGPVAAAYDSAGRLSSLTVPGGSTGGSAGGTVNEGYQGSAVISEKVTGPVSSTVSRTLDQSGRTATLDVEGGAQIQYAYDATGQVVKAGSLTLQRDPNTGLVTTATLGTLSVEYDYNQFGELTAEQVTGPKGSVAAIGNDRDDLGRLVKVTTTVGDKKSVTAYSYDAAGRLASETTDGDKSAYAYDAAGNLVTITHGGEVTKLEYDGRNALVKRGDTTYKYDGAGQLASTSTSGGTTKYSYDGAGRLVKITGADDDITYTLDGFGRRIATTRGGKLTGGLAYLDAQRPIAELDADGKVARQYVYAGSSLLPDYVSSDGTDYLEVPDATGGPGIVVSAQTGAVADHVVRTALGAVESESTPGFQVIGFAGGITDPNTPLVTLGARDFNTSSGRWTAPDPMSVAGGSANLYEYVGGDPINRRDPTGRCAVDASPANEAGADRIGLAVTNGDIALDQARVGGPGIGGRLALEAECGPVGDSEPAANVLCLFGCDEDSGAGSGDVAGADCPGGTCNPDPSDSGSAGAAGSATNICGTVDCAADPASGDPDAPPASGPRTTGNGHVRTADNLFYDMAGVGEFTWLKSDAGDLVVQVRQQPLADSKSVAVTTAVAVSVGGDHLMINAPDEPGQPLGATGTGAALPDTGTFTLPHGATGLRTEKSLVITMADGTRLWVRSNPKGLDLNASLPDVRRGREHGLAGPFTGTPGGPVQTASGQKLTKDQLADHDTLYGKFADSWRISQGESLFTDQPGQDADAFNNPDFPDRHPPDVPKAATAAATTLCERLGLATQALAGCAQDVAVTGDGGFADATAQATRTVPGAAGPAGSGSGAPESEEITPGATVTGDVSADEKKSYQFTVPAGTVGYFAAAPDCAADSQGDLAWAILTADGSSVTDPKPICTDLGRVKFSSGGDYQLVISSVDGHQGHYSVTWKVSRSDHVNPLDVGNPAEGTIDKPGAHDVWTFTVEADSKIKFTADPDCQDSDHLHWQVQDSGGHKVSDQQAMCDDLGEVSFANAGDYRVVVASNVGNTGSYRFDSTSE